MSAEPLHHAALHPGSAPRHDSRHRGEPLGLRTCQRRRVERFAAFYELLPEASRDKELREHLMTYYEGWYAWAGEVLTPAGAGAQALDGAEAETSAGASSRVGQFASILLDGIFMQMVVAASSFDLQAALENARATLRYVITPTTPGRP